MIMLITLLLFDEINKFAKVINPNPPSVCRNSLNIFQDFYLSMNVDKHYNNVNLSQE